MMIRPNEDIIKLVLDNHASCKQARVVLKWFKTPEGGQFLSSLIDSDIEKIKSKELTSSVPLDVDKLYADFERRIRRKRLRQTLFRVAAVLAPVGLFALLAWNLNSRVDMFNTSDMIEVVADEGDRIQVVFQDGSKVFLNSNSRLTYPESFALATRRVTLDGEGYFEVVKNPKRPFIVNVLGADIKVLGTSFNVNAFSQNDDMCVALDEGRVDIDIKNNSYRLKPSQYLSYNRLTDEVLIVSDEEIAKRSLWRDNILCFNNTSMESVIKQLRVWYGIDFVVKDVSIYNYDITLTTGKMPTVQEVLREIEYITPTHFEYHGDKIHVYRK